MSDEQSLLAAIRDNPKEDDIRIRYADWLEENGREPQAAWTRADIRLQQFAPGKRGNPGKDELQDAMKACREANKGFDPTCLVDASLRNVIPEWQRGCVYQIMVEREHWWSAIRPALAIHPIERIFLKDGGRTIVTLEVSRGGRHANTSLGLVLNANGPRELQEHEWSVELKVEGNFFGDPVLMKWPDRSSMVEGVTEWVRTQVEPAPT